ncbi:SAP domain-containing protein [Streptomyces sp. NPDC002088]|uniref:SAP domain-containing protein n=1 Tax=Streptomyces sp. NPDC002088 TaxID=3154665 RepID=UPI00331849B3
MDYEQMSVQELRAECQRRSLGTARSRAELIERLTDHDAPQDSAPVEEDGPVAARETPGAATAEAPIAPELSVFYLEFPAEPDGPDEETHLANRQATIAAAVDAGFRICGDALLASARGGVWLYEVIVRPVI